MTVEFLFSMILSFFPLSPSTRLPAHKSSLPLSALLPLLTLCDIAHLLSCSFSPSLITAQTLSLSTCLLHLSSSLSIDFNILLQHSCFRLQPPSSAVIHHPLLVHSSLSQDAIGSFIKQRAAPQLQTATSTPAQECKGSGFGP